MKNKKYKSNIYISTTIFSIIGTIIYALIVYFLYPSFINALNIVIFFAVVWIVYYLIAKKNTIKNIKIIKQR